MTVPPTDAELWPPALDAMTASPEHHSVLLEDDRVRVLDIHIPPGERTALHTHEWAGVLHILSWSDFVRRDPNGVVLVDSRLPGFKRPLAVNWAPPLPPHTFENVGAVEFHAIGIELKPAK